MDLTGVNVNKPAIHVNHHDLIRIGDSAFQSNCPVCKTGLLPVVRNQDLELIAEDRCLLCAQKFIYDDIDVLIETINCLEIKKIADRFPPDLEERLRRFPIVPWNGED
jgi:hypothetical protein